MTPSLRLLLSAVYEGALAPAHQTDLDQSGLDAALVREQMIRSVPPGLIGRLLGFDLAGIESALLLPFFDLQGAPIDYVRMKIFPPLRDRRGHLIKYLQPRGAAPRLYLVRRSLDALRDPGVEMWLVEGEKKALAVAQEGRIAVGFLGVEGWHTHGSRDLLEDFASIPLRGRVAHLLPDGDAQTNPNVSRGMSRFTTALAARGAEVRLRVLPAQRHVA